MPRPALLPSFREALARPQKHAAGPSCHRGRRSCAQQASAATAPSFREQRRASAKLRQGHRSTPAGPFATAAGAPVGRRPVRPQRRASAKLRRGHRSTPAGPPCHRGRRSCGQQASAATAPSFREVSGQTPPQCNSSARLARRSGRTSCAYQPWRWYRDEHARGLVVAAYMHLSKRQVHAAAQAPQPAERPVSLEALMIRTWREHVHCPEVPADSPAHRGIILMQ